MLENLAKAVLWTFWIFSLTGVFMGLMVDSAELIGLAALAFVFLTILLVMCYIFGVF